MTQDDSPWNKSNYRLKGSAHESRRVGDVIDTLGEVAVMQLVSKPIRLPDIGVKRTGSVTLNEFHKNLEWFDTHKGDSVSVG